MDSRDEYIRDEVRFCYSSYITRKILCGKCGKYFLPRDSDSYEFGERYFPMISQITNCYICDDCYNYLPRISYCATCNDKFASRNSLFRHLKETNHYC